MSAKELANSIALLLRQGGPRDFGGIAAGVPEFNPAACSAAIAHAITHGLIAYDHRTAVFEAAGPQEPEPKPETETQLDKLQRILDAATSDGDPKKRLASIVRIAGRMKIAEKNRLAAEASDSESGGKSVAERFDALESSLLDLHDFMVKSEYGYRELAEYCIANALMRKALERGWRVAIDIQEDHTEPEYITDRTELFSRLFTTGIDVIRFRTESGHGKGWAQLITGNGPDVVSDYSARAEVEELMNAIDRLTRCLEN